jgi:hypothetical protein
MELTKRDLRTLKDEGFIHFRWDLPDHGMGRLTSRAFAAVAGNFENPRGDGPAALAQAAVAAADRAAVADEAAITLRFQKIAEELVTLTRQLIDADEALAAKHEALSIAEELAKDVPDETIIRAKRRGSSVACP